MCGIVGIVEPESRRAGGRGAPQAHARRPAPSRPGRRGAVDRRAGRPRPPPALDRRRRGRRTSRCPTRTARVWIVYNGEIYNHADAAPGPRAPRPSLPHAQRHRDDPPPLRGGGRALRRAPAAACSRSRSGTAPRGRLLLARDRLGIKPLYYALHRSASCCSPRRSRRSSPPAPSGRRSTTAIAARVPRHPLRLRRGDVLPRHPRSCCPATRSPGRRATGSATRRYWQLPAGRRRRRGAARGERRATCAAALEAAVRSHLMSDVPLGLFLSGGIDSSGLAGADGAAWCSEPLHTFSVGFAEARGQRAAATRAWPRARSGAEHREVVVSPDEFFARAAAARLARGRADRVPVERAALLRLAPGRASTSRWCSPAKAPTSCSSATTATASPPGTSGSGAPTGAGARPRSARRSAGSWPRCPRARAATPSRSFLALRPGPARAVLRELRRVPARAAAAPARGSGAGSTRAIPYASELALLRRGAAAARSTG